MHTTGSTCLLKIIYLRLYDPFLPHSLTIKVAYFEQVRKTEQIQSFFLENFK